MEWAGVRTPHAASISRLARSSSSASSWRPVRRARGRALAGADRGAAAHRVLLEAQVAPEPLGALDVVLHQADLDQRDRGRANHEARVRGGVVGVGLRLGEVPASPPGAGAQVRALDEREERAVRAGPVEQAGELARGLDQRAAEEERERRDVDGGDGRAGIVEQVEGAQGELARLGGLAAHRLAVGEAGDEQPLARRARRRRRSRRTGSRLLRASAAASRLPCEAAPRVACSSSPSSCSILGERVDRAGEHGDRLLRAIGQLQRRAELGGDERIARRRPRGARRPPRTAPTGARPRPARA